MGWHVVERAGGIRKFLATYETKEEAEAHRRRLIASDPAYEDVLVVPYSVGMTKPRDDPT
jgi:hypothetical protein